MNNNRNNRRRGRGNRNQSGGGNQLNRIDSRARGNAPQLLDKYKKLAQDAQHNGDRVQAEYYLQFADHYFRVIADNKARQDESRTKRGDGRDQGGDDGEDEDEFDNRRKDERRVSRRARPRQGDSDAGGDEGANGFEGEMTEPYADNPDNEADDSGEERKPRRRRAATKDEAPKANGRTGRTRKAKPADRSDDEPAGFDPSILPPAIGGASSGSDDGDALEAVN